MTDLTLVELTPADFTIASFLLAEAFFDNPSHIYIFPDQSTRFRALQWALKINLDLNLNQPDSNGHSFALVETAKLPGTRQIKAMGFWNPPNPSSETISLLSQVRTGWLTIPLRYGWKVWQRLTEVMSSMEKIKKTVTRDNPVWYLNNMVVAKKLRGNSLGTQLLQTQIQSVVAPSGFPAILMTQKVDNVHFYERLGFEIVDQSIIGKGNNAFNNWCLIFRN